MELGGAVGQAEALRHFGVEEAAAGAVGLNPFAVDDELRDGALADVGEDFFGGAGGLLDVDLGVGNAVGFEKAFGLATVTAPGGGVNKDLHRCSSYRNNCAVRGDGNHTKELAGSWEPGAGSWRYPASQRVGESAKCSPALGEGAPGVAGVDHGRQVS